MRLFLLAFALLALPVSGQAAITCTGQSFAFDTPTDPQAQNYTVPSVSNGVTFVHAAVRSSARTVTAATFAGNAMTQIGARVASTDTATEVFYWINPTPGTNAISINWDNTPLSYVLTAVTCGGVNQSVPVVINNSATGSGTPVTVNCAGTTGGQLVIDFVSLDQGGGLSAGAGQTTIGQDVADAQLSAGVSSEPGGGTITMSQSVVSGDWATICAVLDVAAVAGGRRAILPLVIQ